MVTTNGAKRTNAVTDEMLDEKFGPMTVPGLPVESKPFWQIPPMAKPDMPYIYAAMNAAMSEIRAVAKDSRNEQQRYNFRGIDGVLNAAGPAFRKHGIIPRPRLIEANYRETMTTGEKPRNTREVTVQVEYEFFALDGSSVVVLVPGESLDQSDKGAAKAMSVAYRIALLQMLAIPTDEPDPDASYLTRDGQTEIAPSVARFILDKVDRGPLDGLPELWAIVTEHAAVERTAYTDGNGPRTWYEVFAGRWASEVAGIETFDAGKAVYDAAKAVDVLGWRVGNTTVGGLLQARSAHLKERAEAAARAVMVALEAAGNVEQLGAAEAMLIEYAATKHIQSPRTEELHNLIEVKRTALEAAAAEAGESVTA